MAIDPSHLPIFGDPRPTAAPARVRVACGLLLGQAGLSVVHLLGVSARTGVDLSLYFVPLAITAGFAVAMTAGWQWARVGAIAVAAVSVLFSVALSARPLDVALLVPMSGAVVAALLLTSGPGVREFFHGRH